MDATPIYNTIGSGYNTTRAADPYITSRLYNLLAAKHNGKYLDVGTGTGNYLAALSKLGLDMTGLEPSDTMIQQARINNPNISIIQSGIENTTIEDETFDGATGVLTIHHWEDPQKGLSELYRILNPQSRLVLFSFTPEQMRGYWLCHYFPEMMKEAMATIPTLADMLHMLKQSGFTDIHTEKYFVKEDLQDQFMYSSKYRPERYLDEKIRNGASAFRLLITPEELASGLTQLQNDIESGEITHIISSYENDLGDYLFYSAQKS